MVPESRGYIAELDGLRAVSVLSVIACHTMPLAPGGFLGVDVFFVLSGFLITRILLAEHHQYGSIDILNFYMRRILRLMPAFYLMLIAILGFLVLTSQNSRLNIDTVFVSALYVMNWTRAFSTGHDGFLGHAWSLAVEEQFYLIWPLLLAGLLALVGRRHLPKAIFSLLAAIVTWRCILIASGADPMRIYNGTDTRIDTLLVGALLAANTVSFDPKLVGRLALASGLGLAALVPILPWQNQVLQSVGFTVIAVMAGSIILWAASSPRSTAGAALRTAPLVGLGRISYGVYLWHYPLLTLFLPGLTNAPPLLRFGYVTGASILIATVSFIVVERPCLRVKSRFASPAPAS